MSLRCIYNRPSGLGQTIEFVAMEVDSIWALQAVVGKRAMPRSPKRAQGWLELVGEAHTPGSICWASP